MTDLEMLPAGMASSAELANVYPGSYLIVRGVFHLLGKSCACHDVCWCEGSPSARPETSGGRVSFATISPLVFSRTPEEPSLFKTLPA